MEDTAMICTCTSDRGDPVTSVVDLGEFATCLLMIATCIGYKNDRLICYG